MADWDEDSQTLRDNLTRVLRKVRDDARARNTPRASDAKQWHIQTMAGLTVPNPNYVGRFRGEAGLETVGVRIGPHEGAPPSRVKKELEEFELTLQEVLAELDQRYPKGTDLDADGLQAVIEVAAWAHAEWVRIHPFANGNGRTARLWANHVLVRYGLPPVVRLRPRPDGGYGDAGAAAMTGDWGPTAAAFRRLLLSAS